MENIDGHEGALANQPSSPISRRRQREEQDSNQSDQRRRVDETSATEDNNNNSSSLSISQEKRERLIEQVHLEDAIYDSDNDDDETEEEESSVSDEGWNSNQSNQRRRGDEIAATEDGNNSSITSFRQEDLERYAEEALQIAGQMNVMLNQMEDDDDETEEEESSVSNEGWNSNQSNESILVDETSATEDGNNNNNNSSITSFSQEDLEQAIHIFMQMMQNQQGTTDIPAVRQLRINNEDGSVRAIISAAVRLLNSNVGSSEYGMSYEELMERIRGRIGIVQRGLSKETISSHLKTRVHTTFADLTEEETEICTICQDEYENKVKIATLDCQHEYHEDCITKWLVRKNVCPICNRQGLKAMEEC